AGPEDCRGLAVRRGRPVGTGTGRVEQRSGRSARLASSRRARQRRKQRGRSGELTVSQRQPVWITGGGAATPLGDSYDTIACRLLAGQSGVRTVGTFDVSQHPSQIAGQLGGVPCPPCAAPEDFVQKHRLEQLVLWCADAALRDWGWWDRRADARVGFVLGVGAEWLLLWEADGHAGGRRVHEPEGESTALVERTRRQLGFTGPTACVSAACASGNYALAQARRWL